MLLLINTSAKDRTAAAVDGVASFTSLVGPADFEQLVAGSVEPITLKFLSAASAYETWSADATYTMSLAIGTRTPAGTADLAGATIPTLTTNGKTGSLDLTGPDLAGGFIDCYSGLARRYVILTLEVAVTDPSGNKRIFAQLPVQVNGRVA